MQRTLLRAMTIAALSTVGLGSLSAVPAAAATTTVAWELNEPAGATTMTDTSGNGITGRIGAEVVTGVTVQGATGYRFPRLAPNTPPAHPEHNVQVPHDDRLNPGSEDYSVEVRYRTGNPFGNLIQKGQSGTRGGYWKIQLPQGEPSCLFRGPTGVTNAVRAQTRIDDDQWHVIRCDRTADAVELYVDGVFAGRNRGTTGAIANTRSLSFGGKDDCDQVTVTCDYFGGDVDWVRITRPAAPATNAAPTARFTQDCPSLACGFDGSTSSDPEGPIAAYAWTFGDGTSGSGPQPSHTYAKPGTYGVTLTVSDNGGRTASVTRDVTVAAPPAEGAITFRAAADATGNSTRSSVTVPPGVTAGDVLVMYLTVNRDTSVSDPPGWTLLGQQLGPQSELQTEVWTRVADAADAGNSVGFAFGVTSKFDLTVTAYAGVDQVSPVAIFASASETVSRAAHTTPTVPGTQPGQWLLSYWTDKTSATTDWTAPAGQTVRAEVIGSSAGRVTALVTDAPGGSGGLTATADSATSKAVMWSIVLNSAR